MTYTPPGPPDSDLWLFPPSQTVSNLLPSTGRQLSPQAWHRWSRTQAQTWMKINASDPPVIRASQLGHL